MAVIPQYSAGGPAQARGPVLEQGQSVRVDPRAGLASLGGLMGAVAGSATQTPQLPKGFGQGRTAALQSLGAGVQRLGAVFQQLDEEEAQARNDRAVFDAQQDMRRVYGDFEAWAANEGAGESHRWGEEWQSRLEQWKGSYFEGREIAPIARDAIDMGFARFETETLINTKVRSAQDAFRQARGAAEQAWSMAVEDGDFPGSQEYLDPRYFHADEIARMNFEAAEKIRQRELSDAKMRAETHLMRGNVAGAKAEYEAAPWENPDEKAFAVAKLETQGAAEVAARNYLERFNSGEDPQALLAELEERGEDGAFANGPEMSATNRRRIIDSIRLEVNEERAETVKSMAASIAQGVPIRVIESSDAFLKLPDESKAALSRLALEGAKNDVSAYLAALRSAESYNPTDDPRRDELAARKEAAALQFSGERLEAVFSALDRAAERREPQSALEKVETDYFGFLQGRFDNGDFGGFRVAGSDLVEETDENGVTSYYVNDPGGDIPAQSVPWGRDKPRRRKVELSEADRMKYAATPESKRAALMLEDLNAKEAAFMKFQGVQEELVKRRREGLITNADELAAAGASLLGGELRDAAATRLGSSDMEAPRHPWGRPGNQLIPNAIDERAEALLRKVDELNKQGK